MSVNQSKSVSTNESALGEGEGEGAGKKPPSKPNSFAGLLARLANPPPSTQPKKPTGFFLPSMIRIPQEPEVEEKVKGTTGPKFSDYHESIFQWSFDDPKKMETVMAAKGIFSFSLFRRPLDLYFKATLYREGILKYIELTKRKAFEGWAVVVYVDDSILDFTMFSNEKYYNDLLTEYYISTFNSKFNYEQKQKYYTSQALQDTFFKGSRELDAQYTKKVDELKASIPDDTTAEWKEAIQKINEDFRKQRQDFITDYLQKKQADKEAYFQRQLQKVKPEVDRLLGEIVEDMKKLLSDLQSEPTCILCKYTIPPFLIPGTPFHYDYIGSMARFQAIAEFPDKRVCVRDADTTFPYIWQKQMANSFKNKEPVFTPKQVLLNDIADHFLNYLEQWEINLMNYHGSKKFPFLLAYDTQYVFVNLRKGGEVVNSRFLGGLVDAMPHAKELFTQMDWEAGVQFLRDEEILYNIRGTKNMYPANRPSFQEFRNSSGTTFLGCDEKMLRYLFFEKWKDHTVLFYYPYAHGTPLLLYSKPSEPSSFINVFIRLLDDTAPKEEQESSLFKFVHQCRDHLASMPETTRTAGGQHYQYKDYFFFVSSYPFFADKLGAEVANEVLENIKPYIRGGSSTRKRLGKKRKDKGKRKSRKNR